MTTTAITLKNPQRYPAGTAAYAYLCSNWSTMRPPVDGDSGPKGSAAAGPVTVAADGSIAFTGLTAAARYYVAAQVGGSWTYSRFTVGDKSDLSPNGRVSQSDIATLQSEITTDEGLWIPKTALDTDVALANNSDTNVASQKALKANLDKLFAAYKTVFEGEGQFGGGNGAGTYFFYNAGLVQNQTGNSAFALKYIDPADYAVPTGKALKFRVRYAAATNATASTVSYTVGLYPVTAFGGAANVTAINAGTVVTGSQPAQLVTPAASTLFEGHTADFTIASAGYYGLAVVNSGAVAANAAVFFRAVLERHEV